MSYRAFFKELTPEDITRSGPHVWPKIVADHTVDRFIFRRPELAYIAAKKRMIEARKEDNKDPWPVHLGVRIDRVLFSVTDGQKPTQSISRFGHIIDHEDPTNDIRTFLENLRRILNRVMPDQPLINCAVQLRFYDYQHKSKTILGWQETWL